MKAKTLAKLEQLERAREKWAADVVDHAHSLLSREDLILISQDMPNLDGEEMEILKGLSDVFAETKAERAAMKWYDQENVRDWEIIPPKKHRPALRVIYQKRLEKLEKLSKEHEERAGLVQYFAFVVAMTRFQVCLLEALDTDKEELW